MAKEYALVSHDAIQQAPKSKGCPEGFINYFMCMYDDSYNAIGDGDWASARIHPTT